MDWLLLETQCGSGGQVIALRISDGDRRMVHRGDQKASFRTRLDPTGRMVAVDICSRSNLSGTVRQRAALVHLERGDRIWLPQSLDRRWRLTGVTFDETGRRMAFEGSRDGGDATDIYVADFDVSGFSIRDVPVGLLRHPHGLDLRGPTFADDGETLLFFEEYSEGGFGLGMARIDGIEGKDDWPRVASWTPLVTDLHLLPERGLVYDPTRRVAYVVARGRTGESERIYRVPLDGGPATTATPTHSQIEALAIAPGEDRLAYGADEALRLIVGDQDPVLLVRAPGGHFGGLLIDSESDCLWYAINEPTHATLCAVLLPDGVVHPVARLNQEWVRDLQPVPDESWLSAQLEGLPAAPSLPAAGAVELPSTSDQQDSSQEQNEDESVNDPDGRMTGAFGSLGTYDEGDPVPPSIDEAPSSFTAWMDEVAASGDPSGALLGLEVRRDDPELISAARAHLEHILSSQVDGAPVFFAIAAVAHLGDHEARPLLAGLCEPARHRVLEDKSLPEAEEHFALAALRYLDGHTDRFAAMVIYEEYETIIQQASGVLERDGGTAATKLVTFFLQLYAEQFADVLDLHEQAENGMDAFDAFSRPPEPVAPVASTISVQKTIPGMAPPRTLEPAPRDEESLEWRVRRAEAEKTVDEERFRPFRNTFNPLPPPTSTPLSAEEDAAPDFAPTGGPVDHVDLRLSGIDGQRGGGPGWLGAAALAGGAAGLILAVLSGVLGSEFAVTGIAWIVGSLGLFANRRWGWFIGLGSYVLNGILLVGHGVWGSPPQWITPAGLVIGGLVALGISFLLLPHARRRLK